METEGTEETKDTFYFKTIICARTCTYEHKKERKVAPKRTKHVEPSRQEKTVYCIHCGEPIPSHAVYCRKCGKKQG